MLEAKSDFCHQFLIKPVNLTHSLSISLSVITRLYPAVDDKGKTHCKSQQPNNSQLEKTAASKEMIQIQKFKHKSIKVQKEEHGAIEKPTTKTNHT